MEVRIESFILTLLATYGDVDLCIIAKDSQEGEHLKQEIETYTRLFATREIISKEIIHDIVQSCNVSRGDSKEFVLVSFPSWETPPYSEIVVEDEIKKERVNTLFSCIENNQKKVVITALEALAVRTIPKELFGKSTDLVMARTEIDRTKFIENLIHAGYERSDRVERFGEFSIRGGIIDVFSPLYENPIRIEFMGDRVESLRFFDSDTQKSISLCDEIITLPASEIILENSESEMLYRRLKDFADRDEISKKSRDVLFEKIKTSFPGIEYYLPLFYETPSSFFDYFFSSKRKQLCIALENISLEALSEQFFTLINSHYSEARLNNKMVLSPDSIFLTKEELLGKINKKKIVIPHDFEAKNNQWLRATFHEYLERHDEPVRFLAHYLRELEEKSVHLFIVSRDRLQEERFKELLKPYFLDGFLHINFIIGFLHEGFFSEKLKLLVLSDSDIFGERFTKLAKKTKRISATLILPSEGDYVVHVHHGIGKYLGLRAISYKGFKNDFMLIQYWGSDKLYVPVDRLNLVQKYSGGDTANVELDRFGSSSWKQKKDKAQKAIDDIAGSLLKLYAERFGREGFAFSAGHREAFLEFESSFPFDETEDQITAITDVIEDMESSRPMDRLLCGDVGYGKTEVALRAAYKAVLDGKQVAFLVPTTVLAFQHFTTLSNRFKDYPIMIEQLSRFKTRNVAKEIVSKLQNGKIDIVVGTHRLLQKDIAFKDLGLLVVDEEHKFGVRHKEAIKKLTVHVDVLTLTATPIPRTLQMSLFKIRDFSLMKTPPHDRLSIKTYIAPFRDELIKEAIYNEKKRGGQVYFVHNRVETIYSTAHYLKKLLPDIRFVIGHGQMSTQDLESVMMSFIKHEADVLICTTIIESGLDIPNSNTIIINRADTFGLASLYQLRGRVGRSERQAYAYLLIPEHEMMSPEAVKRLSALRKFSELGSGFNLAMADLEMRGGGEILGKSQSGHMAAIGYELYMELLAKTVKRLQHEQVDDDIEPLLKIKIEALFPESYIPNSCERLEMYKRLSLCHEDQEIDTIREELIDRFGPLPFSGQDFLEILKIKLLGRQWKMKEIEIQEKSITCAFDERTGVRPEKLLTLLKKDKNNQFQFSQQDNRLTIIWSKNSRLTDLKKVLNQLV